MHKFGLYFVIFVLSLAAQSCDETSKDQEPDVEEVAGESGLTVQDFSDGAWTFVVDRRWDSSTGDAQFPMDEPEEDAFQPVSDGQTMAVTVTQDGAKVAIGDGELAGDRNSSDGDSVSYELNFGTFAGGRFVVWAVDGNLQAELTIYGSGVPIIQSERGALSPVR